MVIWIIGLSGAGKTAIGKELRKRLCSMGRPVVFLDGDIFREIMGNDLGHSIEERKKNADRICRFCKYMESQGIDVVFSVLSLFHESQDWNRKNLDKYFEVYLDVDMETVIKRDAKGLYEKARKGEVKNVVGIDIEFKPPKQPDITIDNNKENADFSGIVNLVIDNIKAKDLV